MRSYDGTLLREKERITERSDGQTIVGGGTMFHMKSMGHMSMPSMMHDCRVRKGITMMAAGFVMVQAARVLYHELVD